MPVLPSFIHLRGHGVCRVATASGQPVCSTSTSAVHCTADTTRITTLLQVLNLRGWCKDDWTLSVIYDEPIATLFEHMSAFEGRKIDGNRWVRACATFHRAGPFCPS